MEGFFAHSIQPRSLHHGSWIERCDGCKCKCIIRHSEESEKENRVGANIVFLLELCDLLDHRKKIMDKRIIILSYTFWKCKKMTIPHLKATIRSTFLRKYREFVLFLREHTSVHFREWVRVFSLFFGYLASHLLMASYRGWSSLREQGMVQTMREYPSYMPLLVRRWCHMIHDDASHSLSSQHDLVLRWYL